MLVYEHHDTREDWLAHRNGHIGASEAGAICGVGFQPAVELWKLKTGRAAVKDLSGNPAVAYGNRAEDALRRLFMAKHPELILDYRPYDFLYQDHRPWLRATLDGELFDPSDSTRGILEIKTTTCVKKSDWAAWNGRIPDGYLCQISHQFLATGFDFAFLFAELMAQDGHSELREYLFFREQMEDNMSFVLEKEEAFWRCVETDSVPAAQLWI